MSYRDDRGIMFPSSLETTIKRSVLGYLVQIVGSQYRGQILHSIQAPELGQL